MKDLCNNSDDDSSSNKQQHNPSQQSHERPVHIRQYQEGCGQDRSHLMSLIRELQSHEIPLFDRMKPLEQIDEEEYLKYLHEECQKHEGFIVFAEEKPTLDPLSSAETPEEDARILGYAVVLTKVPSCQIEESEYIYGDLLEIAVTSSARGRGIGRQLLLACEEKVKDAGAHYFRTSVLAANPKAHKIYTQFGFSNHLIVMEKELR